MDYPNNAKLRLITQIHMKQASVKFEKDLMHTQGYTTNDPQRKNAN